MDFFETIMVPFSWLVSVTMVGIHDVLGAIGMPAASGWTWTLSIIGLVLIIRAALIPVFLRQVSAQRRLRLLQPELKKLQDKYKGKTDQLSRQAMAQEQMALYREHGTNPLSACLPMLIQVPFFLALFQLLSGIPTAASQAQGIGAMSPEQVMQFDGSSIFDAPLSASVRHGIDGNPTAVAVLTILMVLVMAASQFIAQRRIMARDLTDSTTDNPLVRQQKVILYVLPVVFGVGGLLFPIGVLIYWTTTNLWTMAQQFTIK